MPTPIPSTQVALGLLAPKNYEDTYPVYDYTYGLGGFRSVGTTTDLLLPTGAGEPVNPSTPERAITSLRRQRGMMVYVRGVTAFYGLFSSTADSSWEIVGPGYFKGGIRSLGTTTQMESIRDEMREEGMIVYVSGVTAYYALIGTTANSGWTTGFTFGSGGGGGGIVGDYVTTFNGRTGAVQGVSSAVAGDGISLSAATGSVTITNIGVTYISAGSFISVSGNTGTVTVTNIGVHSFNGRTGAVTGASLGANTFSELNTFNAGISASGATLGTLTVNSGATVSGRLDVGGVLDVISGATFETTTDHAGVARFAAGITSSSLDVTGLAKFNGNVTVGDNAADVFIVTSGATFGITDHSGAARFASTITATGVLTANGGVTASAIDVTGLAKFNGNVTVGDNAADVLTVTSGATFGITDHSGVARFAAGVTFASTVDAAGVVRLNAGVTASAIDVTGLAKFNGNVTVGDNAADVFIVTSGATFGITDHSGVARFASGITTSTLDVTSLSRFASGISASTIYASNGSTFAGPVFFNGGLTASRIDVTGSGYVSSDFTVGATLSVNGNLYVQGTVTTVNETQLLIQDKYLVLGSTLNTDALGVSAGVYIGSTTAPIISFAYNNNIKAWESSKSINIASGSTGYYIGETLVLSGQTLGTGVLYSSLTKVGTLVAGTWNASIIGLAYGGTNKDLSTTGVSGGIVFKDGTGLSVLSNAGTVGQYLSSGGANNVPTWASFSALTGLTADSVNITNTESTNSTFFITFVDASASGTRIMRADSGITYNPFTNTISCTQIEAIVDGGVWS
jgi:hypothetical protein